MNRICVLLTAAILTTSALSAGSDDKTPVFRDKLRDGSLGPEMVLIPAGQFWMGDLNGGGEDNEKPVHQVAISNSFAMGKYEVTFAEYDAFARATGKSLPKDRGWGRGDRPVIYVSWEDATAYAKWLSKETGKRYRLPSEVEWEYAVRAGTITKYSWGNNVGKNKANCAGCGSQWDNSRTAPVGSFQPNQFGLYDMHGNVWEWVEDCYHKKYEGAPTNSSAWTGGSCGSRVLRGGSWAIYPGYLRSAYRLWFNPGARHIFVGFRLAQDL